MNLNSRQLAAVLDEPTEPPAGTFRVYRLVDAWVRYEADVEADDAEEAWDTAHNANPGEIKWTEVGTSEFDNSSLGVEDRDGNDIIEPREE